MSEVDDIVQRVVLTGNDDVNAAFASMQQAGERAFNAIRDAAAAGGGFSSLATVFTGIAASISIIGVGLFEFTRRTTESVDAIADLASQTGLTIEEMSGLRAAFAAGGVGASEMETAFRRLATTVGRTWTQVKQESRESADKLKGDLLTVSNAEIALEQAQRARANFAKNTADQQKANANSVREAALRLRELQGQDVSAEREALTLSNARLALNNARKKQQEDLANAANEARKVQNAEEQAQLSLSQARRKEEDDRKNDINNVISAVKKVAAGDSDALKTINDSSENIIKGIVGAAKEAELPIGQLKGDITDLATPGPKVQSALALIGQTLDNIEDPIKRAEVSTRLFGRTVSQNLLQVISDPAKIKEFGDRIRELGLAVDSTDQKVSKDFRTALFGLQNDIGLVADKMGTALGPGFTTILNAIDQAIVNNRRAFIEFAETIATKAVPVVESIIRVLSGVPDAASDEWLTRYTTKIGEFASAIGSLASLVAKLVGAIISVAEGVGNAINSVFGTQLNAFDVLFAAWIARIVLGFSAVQAAAATAATGIQVSLATVLAPFALIAAAIYTAVKAYQAWQDAIGGEGKTSQLDTMLKGAEERLKAIAQFLTGDFAGAVDTWKKANEEQATATKTIDDIDKQIADNKKRRLEDIAKAERQASNDSIDQAKKAAEDKKAADNSVADNAIQNLKKVGDAAKQTAEQTKSSNEDVKRVTQNKSNSSNATFGGQDFVDENGIRNVVPASNNTVFGADNRESLLSARIKEVGAAIAKELGISLEAGIKEAEQAFGASLGRGQFLGFDPANNKIPSSVPDGAGGFREFLTSNSGGSLQRIGAGVPIENPPLPVPRPDDFDKPADKLSSAADKLSAAGDKLSQTNPADKPFSGNGQTGIPTGGVDPFRNLPFPELPPQPKTLQTPLELLKDSIGTGLQGLMDGLTTSLKSAIESIAATLNTANQNLNPEQLNGGANPDAPPLPGGVRGDAATGEAETALAQNADSAAGGLDRVASAADSAASALNNVQSNNSSSGKTITAASGGHIRGAGSATSDSIPAWLSDGEFVTRTAAVNFWGVDFMHAINNMRMPKFAMGGLVGLLSPSLPRFADGGLASTSSSGAMPHLGSVDLTTNHGTVRVFSDRNTVGQLRKAAVMKNIGRDKQPSWVK